MRVAYYVNNKKFQNVDCRNVEKGNPGIGGTWHIFLTIASTLAKRENGIDVTLYVQVNNQNLPSGLQKVIAGNVIDALRQADEDQMDYIVVDSRSINWDNFDFGFLKSNIRIIPWCHCFVPQQCRYLDVFAKEPRIARVINVSKEQMDLYCDHPAYNKMDYIYNCVPKPDNCQMSVNDHPFEKRSPIVTYVGSLEPIKSFHVLAMIWPDIKKHVPDAQLYVIGSGQVYDEDAKLGRYGIAEEKYEKSFMPFLTDNSGRIMDGVHFMGKQGIEKNDILIKTKVGVPNPTGLTETFCISAVEMQQMGCVVAAMRAPGYLDTFINGKLVNNISQLKKCIIEFLKASDTPMSYGDTMRAISEKFSIEAVVEDWEKLFTFNSCKRNPETVPMTHKWYHLKLIKKRVGQIKQKIRLLNYMKNIEYFFYQYERIKRHVRHY